LGAGARKSSGGRVAVGGVHLFLAAQEPVYRFGQIKVDQAVRRFAGVGVAAVKHLLREAIYPLDLAGFRASHVLVEQDVNVRVRGVAVDDCRPPGVSYFEPVEDPFHAGAGGQAEALVAVFRVGKRSQRSWLWTVPGAGV
jgi:hypothetical protein